MRAGRSRQFAGNGSLPIHLKGTCEHEKARQIDNLLQDLVQIHNRDMVTRLLSLTMLLNLTAAAAGFVHHPTAKFRLTQVQGHPVYLSPDVDPTLLARALPKLDADLAKIHSILPRNAIARLTGTAFWIERDNPGTPGMTYHPSEQWLRQNGYNPDKARGIEIGNLRHFLDWSADQPFMVLHELSHAFHDRVLGFDHATVRWAFDLAVASKRYEAVPYVRGGRRKAYALTNEKEYFAELSEAYWGRNDFYPFQRSELQAFDTAGFQMIEKLWME